MSICFSFGGFSPHDTKNVQAGSAKTNLLLKTILDRELSWFGAGVVGGMEVTPEIRLME